METNKKTIFLLILILIIATFFRFWKITSIPPGLYPDEAMNGNNALEALKTGDFKTFYPENNGREGLFINIQALSVKTFGDHPWALRIVSAIFGVLTVLGLFFLAKELFPQKINIALISSFLLAVSFWHVNFSRIGFRAIMVPFCLAWSMGFLIKAFRQKTLRPAFLSAIFFGIGFHTYIAFRFAPFLALVPIIYFWKKFKTDRELKKYFKILCLWLVIVFLIGLPIGLYFLKNPSDFVGRSSGISIFNQGNPIKALLASVGKTGLMFNVAGDCNWRHNISCWPELDLFTGLAFIIGLIATIKIALFKKETDRFAFWMIIIWFIIMSLPSILTAEGLPHALRSIGLIPIVFLTAGFGLNKFWEWLKTKNLKTPWKNTIIPAILIAILLIGFFRYFIIWAKNPNVPNAFAASYAEIGNYLNQAPKNINKYILVNADGVLVNNIPMPTQTIMFLTNTYQANEQNQKKIFYLLPENINQIDQSGPFILIPMEKNNEIEAFIKNKISNLSSINYSDFEVFKNY